MSGLEREEILALMEEHGAATPGLRSLPPEGRISSLPRVGLTNPTCGDAVELVAMVEGGQMALYGTATGCTLSRASASLLATAVRSMTSAEARDLLDVLAPARTSGRPVDRARLPAVGGVRPDEVAHEGLDNTLESHPGVVGLLALAELEVAPLRRRCILLPWTAALRLLSAESTTA